MIFCKPYKCHIPNCQQLVGFSLTDKTFRHRLKMQALAAMLMLIAFVGLLQLTSQTEYMSSGEDICRLFPDNTKLRKPGYCNRWIVCKDHKSTDGGTCDGQYFQLAKASCQKSLESSDTYCKQPCTSKTNGYVGDTFNCANWYFCNKTILLSNGICGNGMHFDQNKQMCVYQKDTICNAKYELCQIVPTGVKIRDEHNCDKYITCKAGKATTTSCDAGLYYDVVSGNCIKKTLVPCHKIPHPDEVCGTTKLAKRNKFVSDGATCRGYFYCRDLGSGKPDPTPVYHQCPVEYFFNEEREACEVRADRKCAEDRCDGRDSGYEVAEVYGCQHYIKCVNGIEDGDILKCEDGMYFDAQAQKCTTEKKTYGSCSL